MCITTQVHKKVVERQLKITPSVPRPGDSKTHPTNAFAVGDGTELHPEHEVMFIAAFVRSV